MIRNVDDHRIAFWQFVLLMRALESQPLAPRAVLVLEDMEWGRTLEAEGAAEELHAAQHGPRPSRASAPGAAGLLPGWAAGPGS